MLRNARRKTIYQPEMAGYAYDLIRFDAFHFVSISPSAWPMADSRGRWTMSTSPRPILFHNGPPVPFGIGLDLGNRKGKMDDCILDDRNLTDGYMTEQVG